MNTLLDIIKTNPS